MKKRFMSILLVAIMAVSLAACGSDGGEESSVDGTLTTGTADGSGQAEAGDSEDGQTTDVSGKHHVEITVKDYGTISVELDGDAAPITVENFLKLAGEGFYDGLTFHRIDDGFMIQGGDPWGNGTGGSNESIKGEFAINGIENNLSHTRGAISMARSNDPDSASSQFFIVHQDSTDLDGQYACFGYVTDGIEVVDAICAAIPATAFVDSYYKIVAKDYQPVIESIKVID